MKDSKDPTLNFDSKGLKSLKGIKDLNKFLEQKERQFFLHLGANKAAVRAKMGMLEQQVRKEQIRRACISAESQRTKKNESGVSYKYKVYDNLVTVEPRFERDTGITPPDNTGNHIFKFSKRSRKRLMNRARRLNKQKLPLPFFITLTYHKNFTDPVQAKKHLNVFFQRWRRKHEDFAYFWKMEPQKRGAVHFHLAGFIPEPLQDQILSKWKDFLGYQGKEKTVLNALREQIQRDWGEVTKEIDGIDVPYTKIDYIRKKKFKTESYRVKGNRRDVRTRCRKPRVKYKIEPDFEHIFYGTNVRRVENWKMFLGYMFKYMEKEVRENPFNAKTFKGSILPEPGSFARPPYAVPGTVNIDKTPPKTGRFWGFSYNLDFEALKIGFVDHKDLENINQFCNALNALSFARLTENLTQNAKRKKKQLKNKPGQLKRYLAHYRFIYERQKKRYLMQKNKIKDGYGLQFEVKNDVALKCEEFLKSRTVEEFFEYP